MGIDEKEVSRIVREVISGMAAEAPPAEKISTAYDTSGLFPRMEDAIQAASEAQEQLASMTMEDRRKIIESMRAASRTNSGLLAKLAKEETGMGREEDKVIKNLLAADKTPGVEDLISQAYSGDRGLTLVERAPYGVIGAVTPSTNPSSTIINNAISIIAAGNSAVFAPHPAAKEVSQKTMEILNKSIKTAGGPDNLITAMKVPSIEGAEVLFTHPGIRVLLVTGGPAVVRAAMTSDKRVIAAGPGNPPVVIDETADPAKAVDSIIKGATFDNGILCTAEKEVLLTDSAAQKIISIMKADERVYELTADQMDSLAEKIVEKWNGPGTEAQINRALVGKDACEIAAAAGISISSDKRLLWGVVGEDHPLMWCEQLMPVLPFAVTGDISRTIELAVRMEGGNGHTAIMHSLNVERLSQMARKSACSIFVKNGPSYMGLGMGEGYATLSIATPTGDGLVKASTFTRPLRCVLVDYFRIV